PQPRVRTVRAARNPPLICRSDVGRDHAGPSPGAATSWPAHSRPRSLLQPGLEAAGVSMTDLLWQNPGVQLDDRIQRFCAGDDVILDREFFLFDIQASRAHAEGLQRIGILTADELAAIAREL